MDYNKISKIIAMNEKLIEQNNTLIEEVQELKSVCSRMDNHITFVEKTYSFVRAPLNWIVKK